MEKGLQGKSEKRQENFVEYLKVYILIEVELTQMYVCQITVELMNPVYYT